jgi:hypothetical protein
VGWGVTTHNQFSVMNENSLWWMVMRGGGLETQIQHPHS